MQCVSATIAGLLNMSPNIRFAIFRPIPGSFSRSCIVSGILRSNSSISMRHIAFMFFAFVLYSPHEKIAASSSCRSASAKSSSDLYFKNRLFETSFTLLSVRWAESRAMIRSLNASSLYSSAHSAMGYFSFRRAVISPALVLSLSFIVNALFCPIGNQFAKIDGVL